MAFKLVEKKLEENENIFLSGKEFFKKIRRSFEIKRCAICGYARTFKRSKIK